MADVNEKIDEILNTEDDTAQFDEADVSSNKALGVLAYIGILVLIPIFAGKDSKFARFHANQGLVLFVCELIVSVVISGILGNIPGIGFVFDIVGALLSIFGFVLMIIGIVNAAGGKAKKLPVIGGISLLK